MNQNICVYCSSSNALASEYFLAAAEMGRLIVAHGDALVLQVQAASPTAAAAAALSVQRPDLEDVDRLLPPLDVHRPQLAVHRLHGGAGGWMRVRRR